MFNFHGTALVLLVVGKSSQKVTTKLVMNSGARGPAFYTQEHIYN